MAEVLPFEEVGEEPSDHGGGLKPGARLGRYELLVPIARGGMARVWAARLHGQRGFQKLVAIKTILPYLASEPEFERMFLDEARIASGVHHPNVCEIYELGEEERVLYLAMEWVSGDSLSSVLRVSGKTDPIDPRVVARIVADACAGVHAAHQLKDEAGNELGVVHRDLSPHNILVTADGIAKVADFGVAKALGQMHEQTSAGQLKGKISYMSPEQIAGGAIDQRSDLFSLGCVIYEATTGERPFNGENDAQVIHSILRGGMAPPSRIVQGYPAELEQIVLRAMSPQPDGRYRSAEQMRFALEEYLTRGPLVTQSNVGEVVRARLGDHLSRRRDRIREMSGAGDRAGEPPHDPHRSGVKASRTLSGLSAPGGPGGSPPVQLTPSHGVNLGGPAPFDATRVHDYSRPGLGPVGPPPMHAPAPAVSAPSIHRPPAREEAAPGGRQYALAAGIGILFAVMIGSGSFLIWTSLAARRDAKAAAAASASVLTPVPVPVTAPPVAQASAPAIEFEVTPKEARISVEGRELGPEVRSLPRPAPGTTLPIVVHAPGFEDTTLFVDALTSSPVAVSLQKAAPRTQADAPPRAGEPGPAATDGPPHASGGAKTGAKPHGGSKTGPSLPPNPF